MSLIAVRDLAVTLGAPLFSGLDLHLAKSDRLGLVAANGRGKSTLLRALAGLHEPTAGEVTRARGLRVGLVGQDVPPDLMALTLREATLTGLPPEEADESWRADIVLDDLDVADDLRDRPLAALSGGWQRTALLARAWVADPDVLLLDEPTNHLDLHRIGVLQGWLKTAARSAAIIAASHDRAFLDAATARTLFLRPERSRLLPLPFTPARAALLEADAADGRRFDNDLARAQQLRRQAAKLKNIGINSGSDLLITKTKQLKERADRLEAAARPAHHERGAGAIRLDHGAAHARALVTLDNVTVTAPDGRALFRTGRLWVGRGDRVVVLGPNGSGKTRLLSLVHAAVAGDVLGVTVAPSVMEGWSDQSLGHLDGATPWEVAGRFDVGDARARALLAGAGIGVDLQGAPLAALSGGQRARLAMLVLRLTAPSLYLLDEPTNHLDIEGQEVLEAELRAPGATALLVSHDRAFVRAVGTRFWQVDGRTLREVDDPEGFFAAMGAP